MSESTEKEKYEYDIVLSFAGEDRDYVEKVAKFLSMFSVKVFYDKYEETELWGKDLYTHLDDVYQRKSKKLFENSYLKTHKGCSRRSIT